MIGLFDRDVFFKLICCDLWEQALAVTEVTKPFRLASTNSRRSNARAIERMMVGQDCSIALQRSDRVIASVPIITDELQNGITGSTAFQALSDINDIDGGEQLLSAIFLEGNAEVLVSGDKRFLRALCNQLGSGWQSYSDRIISFELVVALIEERYGFDFILSRCFAARTCDDSLRLSFGAKPNRDSFVEGLQSFGRIEYEHVPLSDF